MKAFQALEENNCQPKLLYSAKVSFKIEEDIKIFHNKYKLEEFMTINPSLKNLKESETQLQDGERVKLTGEKGKQTTDKNIKQENKTKKDWN